MIFMFGFLCGMVLESIHNLILIKFDLDKMVIPEFSHFIIRSFRSDYQQRLSVGWGSSITSVFVITNLFFGCLLLILRLTGRKPRTVLEIGSHILVFSLLSNLLLFIFFFYCLCLPLMPLTGIMGVAENEVVPGATFIGNQMCQYECWMIRLIIVLLVATIAKLVLKMFIRRK